MRKVGSRLSQNPIVHLHVDHIHGFELVVMSQILDEEPTIAELVFADLTMAGRRTDTGRDGMTAERGDLGPAGFVLKFTYLRLRLSSAGG